MKIILISDKGTSHRKININIWLHLLLPILLMLMVYSSYAMKYSGDLYYYKNSSTSETLSSKREDQAYDNFNHVIKKLAVINAEVERLNTLNKYLASKIKVDISDYDLSNSPAQGGVLESNYYNSTIIRKDEINHSVNSLESALESQKLKFRNLMSSFDIIEAEKYLDKLSINTQSIPYEFSSPIAKGYISSPFGKRRDPINGTLRNHGGLDIAARKGTNVYAIANGFVTFSGRRGAYGKLLEISHSESLTSRYAHLDSFSVKNGEVVKKGELIGKVGTTGRVTGPHLHLEIRKNNKTMDPDIYLKEAMKTL